MLTRHLESFGLEIERSVTLDGLTQQNGQVEVALRHGDGRHEKATYRYVIGCDGAHSTVRHELDIPFVGEAFPYGFILGDVRLEPGFPRGMVLRALKLVEDGPPDMFIAVPLPEENRYRVSMMAPPDLPETTTGTDHGIQAERPAPGLEHLQAVADSLLREKQTLSDLRWSSTFRISMRLAENYRRGNVFLAGDAAHIHPPTGGQGMNTGIQDAYNLAWKLALVVNGHAPESLLESYEAERQPVGEAVIVATVAASVRIGRESNSHSVVARLADTQVLVNYRGSAWVQATAPDQDLRNILAGDRVPDCDLLRRAGVGHEIRLFDILRGPELVLLVFAGSGFANWKERLPAPLQKLRDAGNLRVALIMPRETAPPENATWPCYEDAGGTFAMTFGPDACCLLVRPDGYLAWRGENLRDPSLSAVLAKTFS